MNLVLIALLALTHCCAIMVTQVQETPAHTHRFVSFAGGIGVSYVIIHLLPSLSHTQHLISVELPIVGQYGAYLMALVGFMVFYLASRWAKQTDLRSLSDHPHPNEFIVNLLLFLLYNGMVGYLIADLGTFATAGQLIGYTIGYLAHFFANDWMLRLHYDTLYDRYGRYLLSLAVAFGFAWQVYLPISPLAIGLIECFVTGAFILNVVQNELEVETDIHLTSFLLAVVGAGFLFVMM